MNRLLLIVLFLVASASSAIAQNDWNFEQIDTVKGATKAELYTRARSWVAKAFNSAQHVIQMDDKDAGKIICKGYLLIDGLRMFGGPMGEDKIAITITIDVRDERTRLRIEDLAHEGGFYGGSKKPNGGDLGSDKPAAGWMNITRKRWQEIKSDAQAKVNRMMVSYRQAIATVSNDDF